MSEAKKDIIEAFGNFCLDLKLFNRNEKILLAVSGGVDSVVMAHIFSKLGLNFGIAHCNFKLRGKDSNTDENFIKNLSLKKFKVEFYSVQFNTQNYARQHRQSIQESARNLRYKWLEKIRSENGYQYIATAHNADDNIETFFINLIRGTGIAGLCGIPAKNNRIIRPLLFAYKTDIVDFAQNQGIIYREDITNSEDKYLRNKIRHHIIPSFEKISSSFKENMVGNINNLNNTKAIYKSYINSLGISQIDKKGLIKIEIKTLSQLQPLSQHYLYEIIAPFGFNKTQCQNIIESLSSVSGKVFLTDKYKLLRDRKYLLIAPITYENTTGNFLIYPKTRHTLHPVELKISIQKVPENYRNNNSPDIARFDAAKIQFPLTIRKWERGDYFYPLGMKGRKKLSDFFTENKFSLFDKSGCWLLCSGGEIIWIIGHRMDNRFKITDDTQKVLCVKFLNF